MKRIITLLLLSMSFNLQAEALKRFTMGACFHPQRSDSIWSTMASYKPQLHIALGDNVYQTEENHDLQQPNLAAAYQRLRASQAFSDFFNRIEILPVWDDHDYGYTDASGSFKPKQRSQQLFNQMWRIPANDPRSTREGTYAAKLVGPPQHRVQFILLDIRYFRTDLRKVKGEYPIIQASQATMLGDAQWQWLEQQLQQPAALRFIVTSIQFLTTNRRAEGWYNFPKERQRLMDLITKSGNSIVLSGDRHFANFYRHQNLLEFTSSSLNLPITGPAKAEFAAIQEPYAQGSGVFDANFGLIDIDWQQRQVQLSIINPERQIRKQTKLDF